MLIKTGNHNEFRNLLAAMRLAVLNRRIFMAFPKKKFKYIALLQTLCEQGFIIGYEERGSFLIVRFDVPTEHAYVPQLAPFSDIAAVIRRRRSGTLHLRDLDKLRRQKGPLEAYFLSTDRGVVSSNTLTRRMGGGLPLFMIK